MMQFADKAQTLLALIALQNDPTLDVTCAAELHQVEEQQLRQRRHGTRSRHDATKKSRQLTRLEEEYMVQFLLDLHARGFPLLLRFIEELANALLADRNEMSVGKRWPHDFVKRHRELDACLSRKQPTQRGRCKDPAAIRNWFVLMEEIVKKYDIQSGDMWNFDKVAFRMDIPRTGWFVTSATRQRSLTPPELEDPEWATAILAIGAGGQAIPSFLIAAGEYHYVEWYRDSKLPRDWVIAVTKNGLSDNQMELEWLKHFDQSTANQGSGRYRLLISDGHKRHPSAVFERYCRAHKIIPVSVPAHSSYMLQPLDISCLRLLKEAYGREIRPFKNPYSAYIDEIHFFSAFHTSYQATITEDKIRKGFKEAGLAPFNPEMVLSTLGVLPRTPSPPTEAAQPLTRQTLSTPKTAAEFQALGEYIQERIRRHQETVPEPVGRAINSLIKGIMATTQDAIRLLEMTRNIRQSIIHNADTSTDEEGQPIEQADTRQTQRQSSKRTRLRRQEKIRSQDICLVGAVAHAVRLDIMRERVALFQGGLEKSITGKAIACLQQ
ncbi:hypothetical protein FAUST_5239 [Fusarium austroamericanum]|uniref:HTH CENPB-type domain-containing protein n=1 Tax=Fusarium austroamericanum TaxID=282268 RepID=A0AAN6HG50_FUSAU|nr:hypothetical protein FAUST_5239 [Fusarium austroamericanum]